MPYIALAELSLNKQQNMVRKIFFLFLWIEICILYIYIYIYYIYIIYMYIVSILSIYI